MRFVMHRLHSLGAVLATAILILALALGSCSRTTIGRGASPTGATPPGPGSNAPTPPPPTGDGPNNPPKLAFPLQGPSPGTMRVVRAFPRLQFVRPIFVGHAGDNSDRLFVVEQRGTIWVFPNDEQTTNATLFLDIRSRVDSSRNEMGLLGLAFAPDYATSGKFYLNYTAGSPRRTVISEFSVMTNDPNRANPNSERRLMQVNQAFSNHNAGMIAFGPDDMLYVSMGDGGSGGDPLNSGQNLSTLLGGILRIDPSTRTGNLQYGIPSDNPFVGQTNARDEIWAYGLRNPWRFAFDRQNGNLWCADVGQNRWEEVNLIRKGGNYGWRIYEGNQSFNNPNNRPPTDFEAPVQVYSHSFGRSVTGGYVYRGNTLTSLRGAYIYGDYQFGRMWALVLGADGKVASNTQIASLTSVSSFGEDEVGELLITRLSGTLHRLEEPTPGGKFPTKLSETGLFTDTTALKPMRWLYPYTVNVPFWSDNAIKQRWLYVPEYNSIEFDPEGSWTFPVGSVLVKHFELELTVGDPNTRRRLETRVFVHEQDGWAGYTYRWNAQQTDADLLGGGLTETFTINDPNAQGGQRQQTWIYPSRTDCRVCHTEAAGEVLGVNTLQLARDPALEVDEGSLRRLERRELFTAPLGPGPFDHYPPAGNDAAPIADHARALLDVNCGMCHLANGPTRSSMDLGYRTALSKTDTVGVAPQFGNLGLTNPALIKPSDPANSVLLERMRRLDEHRMPPLASTLVDETSAAIVESWIQGLR